MAGLGHCALADGNTAGALASLRQAHQIFRRIGDAKADDIAAELIVLTQTGPPTGKR